MTREQAESELMQIYGMLSEEKKQAIDVLMAQADGDLISRKDTLRKAFYVSTESFDGSVVDAEVIFKMPSVAIPPDHDGCMDCVYQDNPQDAMPCRECKHNYMDKWKAIPNKEGHWEVMYEPKNMGVCSKCGKCAYLYNNRGSAYCPHCGCAMVEPQESEG